MDEQKVPPQQKVNVKAPQTTDAKSSESSDETNQENTQIENSQNKASFRNGLTWVINSVILAYGSILLVAVLFTSYYTHGQTIISWESISIEERLAASIAILSAVTVEYVYTFRKINSEGNKYLELNDLYYILGLLSLILIMSGMTVRHRIHEHDAVKKGITEFVNIKVRSVAGMDSSHIALELANPNFHKFPHYLAKDDCSCGLVSFLLSFVVIGITLLIRYIISKKE